MALTAQNSRSIEVLMNKSIDHQVNQARIKIKLKENQVRNILLSYLTKNVAPYNDLMQILRSAPISDSNYKILIEDSLSCTVLLGHELKGYVTTLCEMDWVSRSHQCVELFNKFVIDLVTAHTYHTPMVMTSLVKKFKVDGENWDVDPPEETVCMWSNIHSIIAQIVAIMPMTSDILMNAITEQFPYYKAGVYPNRAFVHNLIWITKYIPSLLEQVITAITNRLVTMDVNIVEREKQHDRQPDTVFSMDVEDGDDGALRDALDHCMLEMLRWLQEEKEPAWRAMCAVFERIILPTYGIRHVQFLILYTISVSQQCSDRVLSALWAVTSGGGLGGGPGLAGAGAAPRRAAAAHLAGLLARCARTPRPRLAAYLRRMADWCHAYVTAAQDTAAAAAAADSVRRHEAFYAVCHAIFYLVAFKHQHLFASKETINFVESLNLPRLVTCALNPLRGCPPAVARAFAAVTRAHQLVYCQTLLERNARQTLAPATHTDAWFPYDPYTLPRSGALIWPLCVEYTDWSRDGGDATQADRAPRPSDGDDDDFLMGGTPIGARLAGSLSNCISPGFKSL